MKRVVAILASCALAACAGGEAAAPPTESPSVISVNPCSDQLLEALGADDHIIAVSQWSHEPENASASPEWARRFPATSGRAEDLVQRRPDLVVSGGLIPAQTKRVLDHANISALDFPVPRSVDESLDQIRTLGRMVGRQAASEELTRTIETAISRAARRGGEGRRALVMTGSALTGEGTLIGDMLTRMGYRNAAADYGVVNLDNLRLERLVADPPEVIFADPRLPMLRHPALAGLDIERRAFPRRLSWCAGPTLVAMARAMERRP